MLTILGTTAAAMDIEMNFFFTFWGLFLLKKSFHPGVKKMPFPFKRIGAAMFKGMLKSFGYEDMWKMVKEGVEAGKIHLYPCSMTMDLLHIKKKSMHEFVEEPVGAAKFLELCEGADHVMTL